MQRARWRDPLHNRYLLQLPLQLQGTQIGAGTADLFVGLIRAFQGSRSFIMIEWDQPTDRPSVRPTACTCPCLFVPISVCLSVCLTLSMHDERQGHWSWLARPVMSITVCGKVLTQDSRCSRPPTSHRASLPCPPLPSPPLFPALNG